MVSSAGAQGAIDNTSIGLTTPQAGKFTNLETGTLEATTSIKLGAETITNFSGIDDDKVKVSSGDTPGFLDTKIVAGTGVTVTPGTSQVTISAPPVNVEDSTDGVEVSFAREFEFDQGSGLEPALDLNGTNLFIGGIDPTVTLAGQNRTVLSKGSIPNTNPVLQQVVVDFPYRQLAGEHKLKLVNTQGFSEGFISLSEIIPLSPILSNHSTGLVRYWPMDGDFNDASVSGDNGIANGGVTATSTDAQFGQAGNFDGVDDFVDHSYAITKTTNSTVAFWLKLGSDTGAPTGILEFGSFAVQINWHASNNFLFVVGNTGVQAYLVNFDANQYIGSWHHFAMTWDGSTNRVYADGNLVGSNTSGTLSTFQWGGSWIGKTTDYSGSPDTTMDDVSIWNRALPASEITDIYNGNKHPDTAL